MQKLTSKNKGTTPNKSVYVVIVTEHQVDAAVHITHHEKHGQTAEEATELASYKHLYSYGQTAA